MTDSKQHKRLSKTLEICTLRRVALCHFIIFHARTRMGINKSTQRNPAHWSILKVVDALKFVDGNGPQNAIGNRRSKSASRPAKNDTKRRLNPAESATDTNVSDHVFVSMLLHDMHPLQVLASLLTGFAHKRLRLRLTRSKHHVRSKCPFSERSRKKANCGHMCGCAILALFWSKLP
jgi:hypothetical protein